MAANCPCGKPLHYKDKKIESFVTRMVADVGEFITVTCENVKYAVSRHYIALHGIVAQDLPALAKSGVVKRLA